MVFIGSILSLECQKPESSFFAERVMTAAVVTNDSIMDRLNSSVRIGYSQSALSR